MAFTPSKRPLPQPAVPESPAPYRGTDLPVVRAFAAFKSPLPGQGLWTVLGMDVQGDRVLRTQLLTTTTFGMSDALDLMSNAAANHHLYGDDGDF